MKSYQIGSLLFCILSFLPLGCSSHPLEESKTQNTEEDHLLPSPKGKPAGKLPNTANQEPALSALITSTVNPANRNFKMVTLHELTRQELIQRGGSALRAIIQELASESSFHLQNKANIFERGLNELDAYAHQSTLHKREEKIHEERISVIAADGYGTPHNFHFSKTYEPVIHHTKEWMNYSQLPLDTLSSLSYQVTYANFANSRLGGGWRGHGNVQEEQMAQQIPDFALILALFNPKHDATTLHTRRYTAKYTSTNSATPLLITHLRSFQKLTRDYERDTGRIYRELWNLDLALMSVPDAPSINMIALAAPELTRKERSKQHYSLETINDLFNNAFTAYTLVKHNDMVNGKNTYLVLGRWGAGAFGHNLNIVIAIQYLAARLALDDADHVLFTGLTDDQTRQGIEQMNIALGAHFKTDQTVQISDVLSSLLKAVQTNSDWKMRGISRI